MNAITLPHQFSPRSYQREVFEFFEQGGQRACCVWHRRSGKDVMALNWIVRELWQTPGTLGFYVLPSFTHANRVMWTGLTQQRRPMLDFIPPAIVQDRHENQMRIWFVNGSQLVFVGSETLDALMGTNPSRLVFSEYALQRTDAWDFLRPIITQNGGKVLFLGTPRGRNHLHTIYAHAERDPSWFCSLKTARDTREDAAGEDGRPVISEEQIDRERLEGMPDQLVEQEFFCSFLAAVTGAVYGKELAEAEAGGRIGEVPYDPRALVTTAWDIGRGTTAIIFAQTVGLTVRIIDYLELKQDDLAGAAKALQAKPYVYAPRHIGPHDLEHEEWGAGRSRLATARKYGVSFRVLPRTAIDEGIHAARMLLPRCWFNTRTTRELIDALSHYEREYDEDKKVMAVKPRADWATHGADAFRYLAMGWRDDPDERDPRSLPRSAKIDFDPFHPQRSAGGLGGFFKPKQAKLD